MIRFEAEMTSSDSDRNMNDAHQINVAERSYCFLKIDNGKNGTRVPDSWAFNFNVLKLISLLLFPFPLSPSNVTKTSNSSSISKLPSSLSISGPLSEISVMMLLFIPSTCSPEECFPPGASPPSFSDSVGVGPIFSLDCVGGFVTLVGGVVAMVWCLHWGASVCVHIKVNNGVIV